MPIKVSRGESIDRYYLFKLFGFGVFLHHIHHSDPEHLYHTHPWSGLSLFWGSYVECTQEWEESELESGVPTRLVGRVRTRRCLNWVRAARPHRVIVDRPMWTLFIHLPKSNQWGIFDDFGNQVAKTPWEGEGVGRSYSEASDGNA